MSVHSLVLMNSLMLVDRLVLVDSLVFVDSLVLLLLRDILVMTVQDGGADVNTDLVITV